MCRGVLLFLEDAVSEPVFEADQRGPACTRHNVGRMQLVVVVAVGQIVDIRLQPDVLCQRPFEAGVEDPIAGNLLQKSRRRV